MRDEKNINMEDDFEDEDTQKDKYLTFRVAGELYGLEIKDILEIVGIQKITQIPDMPGYLKGVINLRGKIIPVVDVRLRFLLPEKEYEERTCIIVVDLEDSSVGLVVDEVCEVMSLPAENIEEPPQTSKGSKSKFISGIGKTDGGVTIVLNLERLLREDEVKQLELLEETASEVK